MASKRKVSNTTRATGANSAAGMAGAVATWASLKYGVPLEVTIPAVGVVLGFIGRWAAKLSPAS
jgi:hypothetical protein